MSGMSDILYNSQKMPLLRFGAYQKKRRAAARPRTYEIGHPARPGHADTTCDAISVIWMGVSGSCIGARVEPKLGYRWPRLGQTKRVARRAGDSSRFYTPTKQTP